MRISNPVCHSLTAFSAIAILASCSGVSSQMASSQLPKTATGFFTARTLPNGSFKSILAKHIGIESRYRETRPSFFNPDAKGKALIFASDTGNSDVNIYF